MSWKELDNYVYITGIQSMNESFQNYDPLHKKVIGLIQFVTLTINLKQIQVRLKN